jgi:hypothetical protein
MANKYLWKFYWDCGRAGELDGLFVATEEEVEYAKGKHAYFGEVLGKHSEVYGTIDEGDIWKLDVSPEAVEEVSKVLGHDWSGFNPLDYINVQCELFIDGEQCEETGPKDEMDGGDTGYKYLCYECYMVVNRGRENV